ncbi:MAG TPA: CehA/McbA family metallohydrolase [Gammaproteobacteria bacterium]|nr:CehA/McbA family metallohydrolase [Gammaproteobacteria bacterium]
MGIDHHRCLRHAWPLATLGLLLSGMAQAAASGGCAGSADCFDSAQGHWYKGNTHAHALMMLRGIVPHGDSGPVRVATWYRDHGYDFAAITDHNRFTDPSSPELRALQSSRFLLIPGVEVTSDYRFAGATQDGERAVHTTALNVRETPSPEFTNTPSREILRAHIERTAAAGGVTIVNHPNYHDEIGAADLLGLPGVRLLEVWNGEVEAHNDGGRDGISTERTWDTLLTAGMRVYGVAADDAHYFRLPDFTTHYRGTFTLPGSAWVMVNAPALTPTAIVGALTAGRFYATTGVILSEVRYDRRHYHVAVDWPATEAALASPFVTEASRTLPAGEPQGLTIEFIGRGGQVLRSVRDGTAEIEVEPSDGYVRARVTLIAVLKTRLDDAPTPRRFTAWTQPVLTSEGPPHT